MAKARAHNDTLVEFFVDKNATVKKDRKQTQGFPFVNSFLLHAGSYCLDTGDAAASASAHEIREC